MTNGAQLGSAVMFVQQLGRSVSFYQDVLALQVADQSPTAALLIGPAGAQLILRAIGGRPGPPTRRGGSPVRHLDRR